MWSRCVLPLLHKCETLFWTLLLWSQRGKTNTRAYIQMKRSAHPTSQQRRRYSNVNDNDSNNNCVWHKLTHTHTRTNHTSYSRNSHSVRMLWHRKKKTILITVYAPQCALYTIRAKSQVRKKNEMKRRKPFFTSCVLPPHTITFDFISLFKTIGCSLFSQSHSFQ